MYTPFVLFFLFSAAVAIGQRRSIQMDASRSSVQWPIGNGLDSRMTKDTFFFPSSDEECSLFGFEYVVDPWGFIGGTNAFLDLEISQLLIYPDSTVTLELTKAFIGFSLADVVGDADLFAKVYSVFDDQGPFVQLGESQPVKVSEVLTERGEVVFTSFVFDPPVQVPAGNQMHISVDVSRLYPARDTVNVFATDSLCGSGRTTWSLFLEYNSLVWGSFSTTWQQDVDLFIGAAVNVLDPTAINEPVEVNGIRLASLFPNPARDRIHIAYTLESTEVLELEAYSLNGQRVLQHTIGRQPPGEHLYELDVGQLPGGFYTLLLSNGRQSLTTGFTVDRQ